MTSSCRVRTSKKEQKTRMGFSIKPPKRLHQFRSVIEAGEPDLCKNQSTSMSGKHRLWTKFESEMRVFSGFDGWINQNIQEPPKAESRSVDVNTNSVSEKDSNNQELLYDKEEMKKQYELWSASEKKHPWYDAPPKVKAKYKKEKMMFMKVFEGTYKVEPLYVDSVRLCKNKEPKSLQEYKTCSGGQGRIASKVTMDQILSAISSF